MALLEKIDQDVKQAMIAKDQDRLDILRFLKSAVKYVAIDKTGGTVSDADVLQVIQKQIKQRRESIQQFTSGGRQDLADKEEKGIQVLETYLPKQLSDDEVRRIVEAEVRSIAAVTKKDFGRAMKACSDKLAGQADNKKISEILGSLLN